VRRVLAVVLAALTVLTVPSGTTVAPAGATGERPVIVLDPGHSPYLHRIDPVTGLDVSDYANEPEMRDVYAVARLVRARLLADGYRVVLTKHGVNDRVSLARRARIANRAHAALAVSIHDQAGADGGIGFNRGNDIVYYQRVGTYRVNVDGRKVVFTDARVAALSRHYGRIFRTERERVQHHPVQLRGRVGYDLGRRGLAAGNTWMVQLLAHVPWIYNEVGGNSAGRIGLSHRDERRYAAALVAAIERCVPRPVSPTS
jgi:N-acetylmuramoyl-L-alanine amidase